MYGTCMCIHVHVRGRRGRGREARLGSDTMASENNKRTRGRAVNVFVCMCMHACMKGAGGEDPGGITSE